MTIEIKNMLPNGWARTKLHDVAILRNEKVEPLNIQSVPYISLEHIESATNRIIDHGKSGDVKSLKSVFHSEDILYGKLRPYLNKVCQPSFDGVCSTDILVFKSSEAIDNQFLLRLLSRKETVNYASMNSKGINLPRISPHQLGELPIDLPPLNEQKRIVAKTEELLALSRRAREALETIPDLLEQLRQTVLSAAFRGDLTKKWREQNPGVEPASELLKRICTERHKRWEAAELDKIKAKGIIGDKLDAEFAKRRKKYKEPKSVNASFLSQLPYGWCAISIDAVAFVTKLAGFEYTKYVKYDPEGDLSVIKAENAGKHGFKRTDFSKVRSETVENLKRSRLNSGDLLMAFVGTVGRVARVPEDRPYFLGPNIAMIRILSNYVLPEFAELFLRSPVGFSLTMSFSKAVTQSSLSMDAIRMISIFVPPIEEQNKIVFTVHQYFEVANKVLGTIEELKKSIVELDQSILTKAFCGALVPQDPKDEPASALIERIRREKACQIERQKPKTK